MHKFIGAAAVLLTAALTLASGCSAHDSIPTVKLSVWWSDENDRELINAEIEKFKEKYSDEAQLEITISTENVNGGRGRVRRVGVRALLQAAYVRRRSVQDN